MPGNPGEAPDNEQVNADPRAKPLPMLGLIRGARCVRRLQDATPGTPAVM
jgi:hypothetical protein